MSFRKVEPDWTPRNKGSLYCSPACGMGCTRADYEAALHDGAALAKQMGPGWIPDVWENLGWYYSVTKGVVVIHPHIFRGQLLSYTAYFNSIKQLTAQGGTPEEALVDVLKKAKAMHKQIIQDLTVFIGVKDK